MKLADGSYERWLTPNTHPQELLVKHYSLITLILISMATAGVVTVEAGHKTHRRIVCYHCATTGMTAGYGGQVIAQ